MCNYKGSSIYQYVYDYDDLTNAIKYERLNDLKIQGIKKKPE